MLKMPFNHPHDSVIEVVLHSLDRTLVAVSIIILFTSNCSDRENVPFRIVDYLDFGIEVDKSKAPTPSNPSALVIESLEELKEFITKSNGEEIETITEIDWDKEKVILVQLEGDCDWSDCEDWWPFLVYEVYTEGGSLHLDLFNLPRATCDTCVEPFNVVVVPMWALLENILLKFVYKKLT